MPWHWMSLKIQCYSKQNWIRNWICIFLGFYLQKKRKWGSKEEKRKKKEKRKQCVGTYERINWRYAALSVGAWYSRQRKIKFSFWKSCAISLWFFLFFLWWENVFLVPLWRKCQAKQAGVVTAHWCVMELIDRQKTWPSFLVPNKTA